MACSRVVALIDMDCFYCQVESRADPSLRGVPAAVVQYNAWRGGGIIAVNYEARAFGVGRNMRGDEARQKCPDIRLVQVPEVREKADLTKYRDAGKEVINVLLQFVGATVERASVDEAYLDITRIVQDRMENGVVGVSPEYIPNTHIVGADDGQEEGVKRWLDEVAAENRTDHVRLSVGAAVVEEMRRAVHEQTRFRCSAGVAHNKTLAKLACGLHKPNRQTILPQEAVAGLFDTMKVGKLRGLGGKLGQTIVERLSCQTLGELSRLSLARIRECFDEKTSQWLFNLSRGVESEPVRERDLPKTIGCSKNFPGPKALETRERVEFWFSQLAEEVCERLEKDREANARTARGLTAYVRTESTSSSKAGPLSSYDPAKMTRQAMLLVSTLNESSDPELWRPKVTNLSIGASKFEEDSAADTPKIANFFTRAAEKRKAGEVEASKQGSPKKAEEDIDGIASEENVIEQEDSGIDVEELVPDLESFDQSILCDLPAAVKSKIMARVEALQNAAAGEGTSSRAGDERVSCEKCGRMVSPFELPEHLDLHVARELQKELSREVALSERSATARTSSKPATPTKGSKRKKATQPAKDGKRQRDIASFFKKA